MHLEPAAVRLCEGRRLAKLDAAAAALDADEDAEALAALLRARAQCAARIAETQPLGKRLAAAQRAHAKAVADLAKAEDAARRAAESAATALEREHQLRGMVESLEGQVAGLVSKPPPDPCAEQVRSLLEGLEAWLGGIGLSPPAELAAAASMIRGMVTPEVISSSEEATDLEASSPTTEPAESDADVASMDGSRRVRRRTTEGATAAAPPTAIVVA